MKKLLIILIGMGLIIATSIYSARFDWRLGESALIINEDVTSTTSDSFWWVLGEPSVVSSTTVSGAPPVGTNMQVNIGDIWKDVSSMKINIGDLWKDVAGAWVNIGDSWKLIY